MSKKWYEVYGTGPDGIEYLLAKVSSQGNAFIVSRVLSETYKNVKVK
jgi:hypothetical protein